MSEFLYFPIIKTRDAELRAFSNIDDDSFDKILPIYELTKSRKTKKAPDGDIYKRMKKIEEIQNGRPFILDLSTDSRYINPQIEQLLSEQHGFKDWQYFLFDLHSELNIIPMVHIYEDDEGGLREVEEFVREASTNVSFLAVRLPHDLDKDEVEFYIEPIINNLSGDCKLIVIFDAGFVRDNTDDVVDNYLVACSGTVRFLHKIEDVVMLCTSFPSNVASVGRSDDDGEFDIFEERIYRGISEEFPIKYGDYVSINTEQIEMKGGTFVPRIDIASLDGNTFFYKRHRRNSGGYIECARQVLLDTNHYSNLNTWGDYEISVAAEGKPSGISPSFWISVRMSYYMRTRLMLRELS